MINIDLTAPRSSRNIYSLDAQSNNEIENLLLYSSNEAKQRDNAISKNIKTPS